MKKFQVICLITIMMLVVLTAGGWASPRWYVLYDLPETKIYLDTLSFNSSLEEKEDYTVYKAKCWVKYEPKASDALFRRMLENLELSYKTNSKNNSVEFEYRILEMYAYDLSYKEVVHEKYDFPEWETPAPDSGREGLLIKIVNYEVDKRR